MSTTLSRGQPAKEKMSAQRTEPRFLSIFNQTGAIPKTNGRSNDLIKKSKESESDSIALVLPEEVWCKIFRYINNKSTKKVISIVCHEWRKIIRSDAELSGSLALKVTSLPLHDLSRLLIEWPKLHQFEVPFEMLEVLSNVDMCHQIIGHQMLKKIIVAHPKSGPLELEGMPIWARISKFLYDPHKEDSVVAAENTKDLVLELEEFEERKMSREMPTSFAKCKDRGCLCGQSRCRDSDDHREYDNKIAKTMLELECVTINYASYMIEEQVIPFVRELQYSQNLKTLILCIYMRSYNDHIDSELFEAIAKYCVNIRSLVIDIQPEDYLDYDDIGSEIDVESLGWITSFERLEKLTIKCTLHGNGHTSMRELETSWHDVLKEKCFFCKKMPNLKELILYGGGAFAEAAFLSRLHEAFPELETFSMNGDMEHSDVGKRASDYFYFEEYQKLNSATWPRNKLIDVLKSLATVKNLELSNLNVKIEVEPPNYGDWCEEYGKVIPGWFDRSKICRKQPLDCRPFNAEFQEAVEIIRNQFPITTGLFQIQDQEYGHCIVKRKMKNPVLIGDGSTINGWMNIFGKILDDTSFQASQFEALKADETENIFL